MAAVYETVYLYVPYFQSYQYRSIFVGGRDINIQNKMRNLMRQQFSFVGLYLIFSGKNIDASIVTEWNVRSTSYRRTSVRVEVFSNAELHTLKSLAHSATTRRLADALAEQLANIPDNIGSLSIAQHAETGGRNRFQAQLEFIKSLLGKR